MGFYSEGVTIPPQPNNPNVNPTGQPINPNRVGMENKAPKKKKKTAKERREQEKAARAKTYNNNRIPSKKELEQQRQEEERRKQEEAKKAAAAQPQQQSQKTIRPGEVWLCAFPYDDEDKIKKRPVMVVEEVKPLYHRVIYITSQVDKYKNDKRAVDRKSVV